MRFGAVGLKLYLVVGLCSLVAVAVHYASPVSSR